jgi:tetratricopeptide (TPR) repeat protein
VNTVNDLLRRALALAPSDPEGALALLTGALAHAGQTSHGSATSTLAKHAGVICTNLKRYPEAIAYYEVALQHSPDDGYLFVAIGDLERRVGDLARARLAFQECLRYATAQADTELSSLAEKALQELDQSDPG